MGRHFGGTISYFTLNLWLCGDTWLHSWAVMKDLFEQFVFGHLFYGVWERGLMWKRWKSHSRQLLCVCLREQRGQRQHSLVQGPHIYAHECTHHIFLWEQAFVTPVAVTEKIIRGFCRKLQEQASCLDAMHNWTGYAFESFMILWSVNLRASHLGFNSVWCSSQIISSAILKCALIVRWKMFCSAQISDTKFRIVGGL